MNALRHLKSGFPHFAMARASAVCRKTTQSEEAEQTSHKRNPWRFRKPKEDSQVGEGQFKKSRLNRGDDKEDSEDGASGGEGEHEDAPDELEREMENESEVDVDVGNDGISFRMRETRRPHLKMVRQRHKQESHAGS